MSTTAPTKRQIVPNAIPSRQGLAEWAEPFVKSSVGGKYLVAVTGFILTAFVIVHMAGNLQVFLGPDAINAYAQSLKHNATLLWTGRIFLLAAFIIHIGTALWLNWKAKRARPVRYAYEQTVQASFAARHMVLTGLVILVFTLFHIAHYTLGIVTTAEVAPNVHVNYLNLRDNALRPDVYSMMIYGFRNPIVSVLYIIAQILLFLHLTHGVASMFQTVGLNAPRVQRLIRTIAWAVALVVCLGNIGIVTGVWFGVLEPIPQRDIVVGPPPDAPKDMRLPGMPFPGKK
jgi:succinate dehydrogenase / fumarate reductase cytochrome b subunit